MTAHRRAVSLAVVLTFGGAGHVPAQVLPMSAAAVPTPWFMYMRYGVQSPEYAFAAYSFGRPTVMAGIVSDAAASYDEVLVGAGANMYSVAGNGAAVYVMASNATDSWYAALYALPAVTVQRLNVTAFAGGYVPMERSGTPQIFVDPVTALWRFSPRIAVGASYSAYAIEGQAIKASAGPSIQIALPSGSVTVDAMRPISAARQEVRVTLQTIF